MIDEEKWRSAVLKAINDEQEDILDVLLGIADIKSLESLLIYDTCYPYEFPIFNTKIYTIPMAKKFMARGVSFHDFSLEGSSIYAYLLSDRGFPYRPEERKKAIDNTLRFVSFLKNELNVIPKPETVLNDLSRLALEGDAVLDLLAAVYEFPHDDSQKMGNKHWYTAALGGLKEAGSFWGPRYVKTYQFFHNKKISLAAIENEEGQNLLHVLFRDGYVGAIYDMSRATFTYDSFGPMIDFLLQVGVDPNKKDKHGKVPYDYADQSVGIEWFKKRLDGKSSKEIVFPLEIVPIPPHESSAVVSFSREPLPSNSTALGKAVQSAATPKK